MSSRTFVERLECTGKLEGHGGCVNSVMFSEDGKYIITGSDDQSIKVWNSLTKEEVLTYRTAHTNNIFWAKDQIGSQFQTLLSAAADGRVMVTEDFWGGRVAKEVHRHEGRAHRLDLIPSEPNLFLSCGEDGKAHLFDLRLDTPLVSTCKLQNPSNTRARRYVGNTCVYCITANPSNANIFAISGLVTTAQIMDTRKMDTPSMWVGPKDMWLHGERNQPSVTGCRYNYAGGELLLSYNDADVYTIDMRPESVQGYQLGEDKSLTQDEISSYGDGYKHKFEGHRNNDTVKQVAYLGPRSEYVVSGSDCGHVFIWDARTSEMLRVMYGDSFGAINCLSTHPSLPLLATSGLNSDAKLWEPVGPRRHAKEADGALTEELDGRATVSSILSRNDRGRMTRERGRGRGANAEDDDDDDDDDDDEGGIAVPAWMMTGLRRYLETEMTPGQDPNVLVQRFLMQFMFTRGATPYNDDDDDDDNDDGESDDDEGAEEDGRMGRSRWEMRVPEGQVSSLAARRVSHREGERAVEEKEYSDSDSNSDFGSGSAMGVIEPDEVAEVEADSSGDDERHDEANADLVRQMEEERLMMEDEAN